MRPIRVSYLLTCLSFTAAVPARGAAPGDIWRGPEVELFRKATLPSDDRSLLALLRQRSPRPEDLVQARKLVALLGSENFQERERASEQLRDLGPIALPVLKANVKHRDVEVARRVRPLLAEAERVQRVERDLRLPLARAALRLLVRRRAEGAVPALLRYLPFADAAEQEEVYYGLDQLLAADAKGKAVLAAALRDPHPARRAVAACILARAGEKAQRAAARRAWPTPSRWCACGPPRGPWRPRTKTRPPCRR
jgi:hypothetical protein